MRSVSVIDRDSANIVAAAIQEAARPPAGYEAGEVTLHPRMASGVLVGIRFDSLVPPFRKVHHHFPMEAPLDGWEKLAGSEERVRALAEHAAVNFPPAETSPF